MVKSVCQSISILFDGLMVVPHSNTQEGAQPLDSTRTYRKAASRVPAPMREEANGVVQPLKCAWTNVETDVKSLVPAPRLELGTT
jgi:hypothetical protein